MNRRVFLSGSIAVAGAALAPRALANPLPDRSLASSLRGAINVEDFGVRPGDSGNHNQAFQQMLERSAELQAPIFLPPGEYVLSDVRLPHGTRLSGVPGASRIVYNGGGETLLGAENVSTIHLEGLTFDGGNHRLGNALIDMKRVDDFVVTDCAVLNSGAIGIALERTTGRIERSTISGAASYAVYSVNGIRMQITNNTISDCADGGILVHRWETAQDGSIISGNRIERIGARSGGTGQYGNGINLYRANNVIVSGNHVSDCAFSAIRANSSSNAQITQNQCLRSGETAIYAEFAFEGALISANLVDTAAIGISIANMDQGGRLAVCQGNIVRNVIDRGPYQVFEAMGFGVGIVAEADTAISGNVIEGAERCGVQLGWGPYLRNIVATGNLVRDTREGFAVSVVDGAGAVLIADNIISGAQRGVTGYRWKEAVTGELASGTAPKIPGLTVERNIVNIVN